MSDIRAEFEAYVEATYPSGSLHKYEGEYTHHISKWMWDCWNKSRAALVVELTIPVAPNNDDYEYPAQNDTFNSDYSEFVGALKQNRVMREALTKSGVTVK